MTAAWVAGLLGPTVPSQHLDLKRIFHVEIENAIRLTEDLQPFRRDRQLVHLVSCKEVLYFGVCFFEDSGEMIAFLMLP